ncbi:MAG TPA: sugar ABC transporter permease [Anaerolineales bacterium]|nr:sugar ABC transporter permease [Anaerolineales bacterium]
MRASASLPVSSGKPKWVKEWFSKDTLIAWIFILPSLIGFITFYALPAVRGLYFSFTDWDMLSDPKFIWLDNYKAIFADKEFWRSLRVTVYYVLLNIPAQTVLAIGLAVVMDRVVKSTAIRSIFIIPWLLPSVIVATIWSWIMNPTLGPIGSIFRLFGWNELAFLGSPDQAMPAVAIINIWQYTGNAALLIFAGLQTIPKEVYEAGAIDGASEGRMFWSITLPLLRPVLVFVLVTTIIGSFQVFDTIAVTTTGGPAGATRVILWYIFEYAFNRFQMGYATAVSVILFLILITITFIQMRFLRADSSDLA